MALQTDVRRITRALNWIGAVALAFGLLVVVWALWWTSGVDDFRTAVIVAALGFGLPSVVALAVAWLLDPLIDTEKVLEPLAQAVPSLLAPTGAWDRALRYLAAIGVVIAMGLLRWWLDPVLADRSPFLTFFLAVAIAAWVGGFGASALATALSIAIAWNWYLHDDSGLPPDQLRNVVAAGVFAATALAIGAIIGALRAAASVARRLAAEAQPPTAERRTREASATRARVANDEEGQLRAMADGAPALMWLAEPSGARIHFNRRWLDFTGVSVADSTDRGWESALHPHDRDRYRVIYNAAIEARMPYRVECRLRRFDGEYRRVCDEGVPRFLPDGGFAGYVGACMEIAERTVEADAPGALRDEAKAGRDA